MIHLFSRAHEAKVGRTSPFDNSNVGEFKIIPSFGRKNGSGN